MGFTAVVGGTNLENLPIEIGDEDAGIIIHDSPGETKDGETVDADVWIEIYAEEIHFSEV